MAYTVLARRYRSQAFGDVVGQEAIGQTLRRAIATGRVAHAYLFTGTRGVGKTSMARIFARALNAPDTVEDCPRPGAEAQPETGNEKPETDDYPSEDVQQRMAEAIMRGDDLNVIEIDAASNRSVDEARQLIANASLSPTSNARYKVYIIDEVHMLTREAFNTLLKTMEEPPAHVKFILCTTEPHRVPPTIQSRCQKFDFRDIPTQRIADHLKAILEKESIDAEEQVVWQLARLGNGSMRDALSLLDRLIATGDSPLTAETLEKMLGLPDQQLVAELIDAIAASDARTALERTASLLNRGIGQDQLVEVLIDRLRQLMLIAACGPDSELIEMSDEARTQAVEQAKQFDAAALTYMIALCDTLQRNARSSPNPRALLDTVVVRLAMAEKMADVTALLAGGASNNARLAAGKKN
ncbi:MAG: DNA polymerase III subunit gamma/tau [Phycisphaeraceae bacterium]